MNPQTERETLLHAYGAILDAADWLQRFREHSPIEFGGEWELAIKLDEARLRIDALNIVVNPIAEGSN